jgi:hypothetical protein
VLRSVGVYGSPTVMKVVGVCAISCAASDASCCWLNGCFNHLCDEVGPILRDLMRAAVDAG